jgi:hypothetical protein
MTERYFILLYNKIDMKMKMPKISSKVNYQIIMVFILLVVVVFITAMPWASNTFHEALENITPTTDGPLDGAVKDKVKATAASASSTVTPVNKKLPSDVSSRMTNVSNMTTGKASTTEGFVSDVSFRDSPTVFPGTPVDTTNWNPSVGVAQADAAPLDRDSLYMFDHARFSPSCCAKGPGSGMSSSMGCVCLTNKDAFYITQGRGGGNMNPTDIF